MSDVPSPTPAPAPTPANVSFTLDDAVKIADALGAAATAVNPAIGGAVAAITGITELLRNTIIPAIQHMHDTQLSIAQQAQLAADSALERARVGAPAAVSN
jgi:hypothetical protein